MEKQLEIEVYAEILNLELCLIYSTNRRKWQADFKGCSILDGGMICSAIGEGVSPQDAIENFVKSIKGKKMGRHLTDPNKRQEFIVPTFLI